MHVWRKKWSPLMSGRIEGHWSQTLTVNVKSENSMKPIKTLLTLAIASALVAGCQPEGKEKATVAGAPVYDQASADAFLAEAEAGLKDEWQD